MRYEQFASLDFQNAIQLADAQTSLAVPVNGSSGFTHTAAFLTEYALTRPRAYALVLKATGSVTFASGFLWGYLTDLTLWIQLASLSVLNDNTDIALTSVLGWGRPLLDVGICDRYAVSGSFTGTVSSWLIPYLIN